MSVTVIVHVPEGKRAHCRNPDGEEWVLEGETTGQYVLPAGVAITVVEEQEAPYTYPPVVTPQSGGSGTNNPPPKPPRP